MANPEHVNLLQKGVKAWNEWREQKPGIIPDLSGADLTSADLRGIAFHGTNLFQANLSRANLNGVDLFMAMLFETNLRFSHLNNTDFYMSQLGETFFVGVDLSNTKNLETCFHNSASTIDYRTLAKSGRLPIQFLRGVGLPDQFIEYYSSLLSDEAIQFYSCFISYSHKDEEFAKRLHAELQNNGIRCWFAPEDMKTGDKIRGTIDEAIRFRDKLLIVLSEESIKSDWVEKEVETAFEEEKNRKQTVLFPIRIDNTVMDSKEAWAADIRRTRHIGDFDDWKNHDNYTKAFDRLLRDFKKKQE